MDYKIGDKVVEQDSATLNWSASNADKVTITPMGSVAEKVVRKSPCPVLTVRHPEHEFIAP